MADGSTYEVITSGRTCQGGISALFGKNAMEADTIALLDGSALAVKPAALRGIMTSHPEIKSWLERLVVATGLQVQRSAGCNAHHTIEQRLARWLLNAIDEARRPDLSIKQDMIAGLLGVRPASVSETLSLMRAKGLVDTGRSRIAVIDKLGLMAMACECYQEDVADRRAFFGQY